LIGTILNVGAIVAGGATSLIAGRQLSPRIQQRIKIVLGVLTVYAGFSTIWDGIHGTLFQVLKQIAIALLALIVGNLLGKALKLQKGINRLAEQAKNAFHDEGADSSKRFGEGFVTCSILFCVGPMALLGAIDDGLYGRVRILALKSVMDGLATMAFVKTFGIGPIFAAIPVLAYQGTVTLGAQAVQPLLENHLLLASINVTGGFLILCISLVILDIQKVPLADYLPSLAVAPAITWLLR
jgi:hypothetical protein